MNIECSSVGERAGCISAEENDSVVVVEWRYYSKAIISASEKGCFTIMYSFYIKHLLDTKMVSFKY